MADSSHKPIYAAWREDYRAKRYLAGKPEWHIAARLRYQMEGVLTLTDNGQIGPEPPEGLGLWLWERITHTMHEFELRGRAFPNGFLRDLAVPRTTHPAVPPELEAFIRRKRTEAGQIFKFGRRAWLERATMTGEIRFAGASFYRDPSLNSAIRDDELGLAIFPQNGVLDLARCGIRGIPSERVPGGVVLRHPTDFYVQCFSGRFALRSFNDFEADACLIVYDAPELFRRLEAALKNRFPDWSVGTVPVHYVDPDDPPTQPLPLPALKSLRYAYQAEVRVVCHPKQGVCPRLDPIFINIKPLEDIAEIITLSSGIP